MRNAANSVYSGPLPVAIALGDHDPCRTQYFVVNQVAAMELVDHGIGRMGAMRHLIGGLVTVGVELLANRGHRADAIGLEEVHQGGKHHPDSLDNRLAVSATLRGIYRT